MQIVRSLLVFCIMACLACSVHWLYPMYVFCHDDDISGDNKGDCELTFSKVAIPVGCILVALAVLVWWETRA